MPISKVQLPDNSKQDIHDARISDISSTYPKFYVGTCPTAAATAAKVVTVETFPTVNGAPVTGTVIAVKFNKTNSATAPTLNVNGLGAESIYYNAAVISSTSANYGGTAGRYVYYMWDGTYWCWLNHGVDNDTNTLAYVVRYQNASKPLTGHLARYRLLFTSADGTKWVPANTGTSTDATSSKTVNQTPIDPFGPIVYYGSTTIKEADEIAAASALYIQQGITFGHSFNVTNAALTLTVNAPVYIKCAPQSNGSAIIDSTTPYVQSLPSTADGKIYIYLGQAYGATIVELSIAHPVYYYKDGAVRLWTNASESVEIESITTSEINQMWGIATIINFYFGDANDPRHAEEGMTWREWVNTSYNTDNMVISGNNVTINNSAILLYDGNEVRPDDEIINDTWDGSGQHVIKYGFEE